MASTEKGETALGNHLVEGLLNISNIVYKINCCDCDASYVGETKRALKTHVKEHHRAIEKMNLSGSALAQHA